MCHDAGLVLGQVGKPAVPCYRLRHAGNGAQRVAVSGVQLLGQQHQSLALGEDGVAAGGVGIVYYTHVRDRQAGGRRKLGGRHAHLFHMGRQAALRQLAEHRVFAGLRVGSGSDQSAHVGLEFVGNDGVILFIRHAENILLRGGVELQRNGCIGSGAHIVVDQCPDGALEAAAAKWLGIGGIPDHWLHQRPVHFVRLTFRCPEAAVAAQHDQVCICVEVHQCGTPDAFEMLILHGVDNGHATVDAAFFAAP